MIWFVSCAILIQTHQHIFARIVFFSKEVWSVLKQWLGLSVLDTVPMGGSIHNYGRKCRTKINKDQRRVFDKIMIYLWWNVWNTSMQPRQVAFLCKEEHSYSNEESWGDPAESTIIAIAVFFG